ncbi:hypothetical protein GCM10009727_69680 [Actinomadura napierensis]|uniref:Secreted protein n=1 Tax=Actinomadura napierensis TaxID=267854 RepID=A0ABN3ABI2_9ACTN
MSTVRTCRWRDRSIPAAICWVVLETAGPLADATSSVSVPPRGSTTIAASTVRARISRRARGSLGAVRALSGASFSAFSCAATCAAVRPGATTATGMRCGDGEWNAPM